MRPRGSSPDTRSAAANLLSLFGRRSSGNLRPESPTMKRSASGTQPMCLICLENLTADDFQVCSTPFCYASKSAPSSCCPGHSAGQQAWADVKSPLFEIAVKASSMQRLVHNREGSLLLFS